MNSVTIAKTIQLFLKEGVSPEVIEARIYTLLSERSMLGMYPSIIRYLERLCVYENRVASVFIKTPFLLNEEDKKSIEALFPEAPSVFYSIDTSLGGGFIAYSGSRFVDGSLSSIVNQLK